MPEAPISAAAPQIVIAFDFGRRRLGLAAGDTLTRSARPLRTLQCVEGEPDWAELLRVVADVGARQLVVGCPYNVNDNVDDSASATTGKARAFAAELQRRTDLPVHLVDERYSSLEAEALLREQRASGQRRSRIEKTDIDAMAAALILERWLSPDVRR